MPSRVDSWNKRAGAGPAAGAAAGGAAGAGGGAQGAAKGAGVKKSEYMGPDGDLVANLERDVLDRSPGIRCAGLGSVCLEFRASVTAEELAPAAVGWCQ